MKLSKNFSLRELTKSETAARYGIDNKPNPEFTVNLQKLCETVLQPIRDEYKKPIVVSSGYRCQLLNKIVKGVAGSDHLVGAAADIHSVSDTIADNKKLFNIILKLADEGVIHARQIISEKGCSWIHISINNKYHSYKNNEVLYR